MFHGVVTATMHDLSGAFEADLSAGRLTLRVGAEARVLAVPASVFATLLTGDAARLAGEQVGAAVGADVKALLGADEDPTPETVGFALSAALALRGLGTLRLERWGDALLAVLEGVAHEGPAFASFLATVVGAAVAAVTGSPSRGVLLSASGAEAKVLLVHDEAAAAVAAWVAEGQSQSAVLARLHGG